jgi:glycosyltransferase involved in cell wall biosynthesis
MKWAYFAVTYAGGAYAVFRNLRKGLAPQGIDLRWIASGAARSSLLTDPVWRAELECGEVVAADETDDQQVVRAIMGHLTGADYVGVIVAALATLDANMLRYLPSSVIRVQIVHNMTPALYAAALANRDFVHATISVSPRIRDDLVGRHRFAPERVVAIPNGIDPEVYRCPGRSATPDSLRLVSLGRIEEQAKGVLWLPRIMDELGDVPCHLTIWGEGPDLESLRRRSAPMGDRIRLGGGLPFAEVPRALAEGDVFLMPSRFEGLPVTLLEAMASGCVPVASRIRGVTDVVIENGTNGFLFPVADTKAAADGVRRLAKERGLLQAVSLSARKTVEQRFSLRIMADAYAELLWRIAGQPPTVLSPLALTRWYYPRGLRPGWRTRLPAWMKNWLRELMERSGGGGSPSQR